MAEGEKIVVLAQADHADLMSCITEMNRQAWAAVWALTNLDASFEERSEAATDLKAALAPFLSFLPEGWERCGACGEPIACPGDGNCLHDVEVGLLCLDCSEAQRQAEDD